MRPDDVALRDAREPCRAGARAARRFRRAALGRALSRRAPRRSAQRAHCTRLARRRTSSIITGAAVRDFALHARRRHRFDRPRRQDRRSDGPHAGRPPTASGRACARWPATRARAASPAASPGAPRCAPTAPAGKHHRRDHRAEQRHRVPASDSHMIVYPLRGGATINLVAVTAGAALGEDWSGQADPALLDAARSPARPASSAALIEAVASWTAWPIHTVDVRRPMDARRRLRADRRRRACDDALCRARCGDGHRGRRDAGRCRAPVAGLMPARRWQHGKPQRRARIADGDPPRRAQPLRLACRPDRSRWRATFPQDALAGAARRRPRLALRVADAVRQTPSRCPLRSDGSSCLVRTSIVQRQRAGERLRQRVPPAGLQPGLAQRRAPSRCCSRSAR